MVVSVGTSAKLPRRLTGEVEYFDDRPTESRLWLEFKLRALLITREENFTELPRLQLMSYPK